MTKDRLNRAPTSIQKVPQTCINSRICAYGSECLDVLIMDNLRVEREDIKSQLELEVLSHASVECIGVYGILWRDINFE